MKTAVAGGLALAWLVLAGCVATASAQAPTAAPGYHVLRKLPLGGEGAWDYLTIDSAARRLYISRGTHVMVVALDAEKVVGDVPNTPGVHGIALAPELNRGFTSNGRADTSTIFDLTTLALLGEVKTGANPDAIVYDPASKRVFTFNGRSQNATAFDAATGKVLATIPLAGRPEFAGVDGQGKVYVNIEDASEVTEIDSKRLVVTRSFSIKPGEEPSGLALDAKRHRVFSGCHNQLMTVLDTQAGRVIDTVPIGAGVDGNGFDAETGLAFSSNGDGTLTVAREKSPGRFEVAETIVTQRGARTLAIDAKTHNVYLPTAEFAPAPPGPPRQRPTMIKGSFTLLVVGK